MKDGSRERQKAFPLILPRGSNLVCKHVGLSNIYRFPSSQMATAGCKEYHSIPLIKNEAEIGLPPNSLQVGKEYPQLLFPTCQSESVSTTRQLCDRAATAIMPRQIPAARRRAQPQSISVFASWFQPPLLCG